MPAAIAVLLRTLNWAGAQLGGGGAAATGERRWWWANIHPGRRLL